MTNYKIKIYCTSKAELLLNNYPINNDSKQDINNCLQPDDDDRINEICILYKQQKKDKRQKNIDNINYTIKCLEIFCNTLFSKSDFISYIKYMHETGFTSIKNNIYFIDNQSNEIIYKYNFVKIVPRKIKKYKRLSNNSIYARSTLYTR